MGCSCLCFARKKDHETPQVISPEEAKIAGNELFKTSKYMEAIEQYTKAINADPKRSIFYSNRALCYYKLKDFKNSYKDGNCAYTLDKTNFKGLIMCAKSKASEALEGNFESFQESLVYCKQFKGFYPNFTEANKQYCKNLKRKIKLLFHYIEKKQQKLNLLDYYFKILPGNLFETLRKKLETEEVAFEALNCPLTIELFIEPILISSGWTYERKMIDSLIQNGNLVDPLTRSKFVSDKLYQNCCIEAAVKWYSKENPEMAFMADNREIEI